MKRHLAFLHLFVLGILCVAVAGGQERVREAIPNWPALAFWQPSARGDSQDVSGDRAHAAPQAALSSPLPFIAVDPCRQYDSRNFTPLLDNTSRTVTLTGAPCGIPSLAQAVSVNITIFNITGAPSNGVFRVGIVSPPPTAWINFPPTETQRANAGIVATNGSGQIIVQVNMGAGQVDFTCDVNGYYAGAGIGSENTFLGLQAGNFTMTGDLNTAVGFAALQNNTTGGVNTATGRGALLTNTTGSSNTATGGGALESNTVGDQNTATGSNALFKNTTGSFNIAIGANALSNNTTGAVNTALGVNAGLNLTTGSRNICIGNSGVAGESNTIRIGGGLQTATFIAGIRGQTTGAADAIPVLIDSAGQLGTISSSSRFKEEIEDMREASNGLMNLRPVTFRYKGQAGDRKQFGLIAEEVEKMLPELVVHSASGEVETVLYHEMPAMLLNELQKQRRTVESQQAEIEGLKARLANRSTAIEIEGFPGPHRRSNHEGPDLVVSDRDGRPETARFHLLVPMLLNEVQRDRKTIADLKERLEALMAESVH